MRSDRVLSDSVRTCCVVLALLASGMICSAARGEMPESLLENPSFETRGWYYMTTPLDWQPREGLSRDTSRARSGEASMRIAGGGRSYSIQGGVALRPATAYTLSAWVWREGPAGAGVRLAYYDGEQRVQSEYGGGQGEWRQVTATFTTPEKPGVGEVRIGWDLADGESAWVDDVQLRPVDEKVSQAPAPTINPAGKTFTGPGYVTLSGSLPRGVIRYTIDGSDPTRFSLAYDAPFRLSGSVKVKARTFHTAYTPSDVVEADFTVQRKLTGGVPFEPTGYGREVRDWWAGHLYNPDSPNAWTGKIDSPQPRINVADVRAANPKTTTAGIAEALAQLPETGGTLFFPKAGSPYILQAPAELTKNYYPLLAQILVLRRGSIHFVSDGATIRSEPTKDIDADWPDDVNSMFTFSSMEYADKGTMQRPSCNFYFQNLTFDGGQAVPAAIFFRHCGDILFDNCTFTNFRKPRVGHPGLVSAACCTDNLWARDCTFEEGRNGIYYDGVHNGGVLRCTFGPKIEQHAVLLLTNNDMVVLSVAHRTAQYFVVADSTFKGPGRGCVTMTGANCLVTGNTATGPYGHFLHQRGRGRSNIQAGVRYNGTGVCAVDNEVSGARTFARFDGDCMQQIWDVPQPNVLEDNRATGLTEILWLEPGNGADLGRGDYGIEDVLLRDNVFQGHERPRIVVRTGESKLISDVVLEGNTIEGQARPLVVDPKGHERNDVDVRVLEPRKE